MTGDIQSKLKKATGWSLALGVLMIIAGIVALSLPLATGLFATVWLGWVIAFAGVAKLIYAWQTREEGGFPLKLLVALLYLGAGVVLVTNPLEGVLTLTLVLASFLFIEGVFELVLAFQLRPVSPSWGWVLADGLLTLLFGILIWRQWPVSAGWVIGLLIGISIISSGISRVMLSLAARSVISEL
jgi:uncharacterized membrane protein HdeD (DUF308 family)